MKIKATVYPNKESNTNLKAMVILEVEDCLIINSVKIVEGKKVYSFLCHSTRIRMETIKI